MAKIAKHFTVTKHLPHQLGQIEFSGIVYKNDPENYDIEDVVFITKAPLNVIPTEIKENITEFFRMHRQLTDPDFHHEDIVDLLDEWLSSDEANSHRSQLNEAA